MQRDAFLNLVSHGTAEPLPKGLVLKAGPLRLTLIDGSLRYIRYGNEELLRMMYVAVRDQNWDTIVPRLRIVNQEIRENAFDICMEAIFQKGDIWFDAYYHISGTAAGKLNFRLVGKAKRPFLRNRIGFCILHPIDGCKGIPCAITEPSGRQYVADFPVDIMPDQPFRNIRNMRWQSPMGTDLTLEMRGDVFETEDQRNWTDASYKTYCTPLDLPFPVRVVQGDEVNQEVVFWCAGADRPTDAGRNDRTLTLSSGLDGDSGPLRIGLDLDDFPDMLTHHAKERLGALRVDHLRISMDVDAPDWRQVLLRAVGVLTGLSAPLFVALQANEQVDEDFLEQVSAYRAKIKYLLLLTKGEKVTTAGAMLQWLARLRRQLPDTLLGVGTDAYFAELNRQRPKATGFDFISFSINPQVHAFDHASLVETLAGQREVLQTAQRLYPNHDVFISPISLKPRFNPNATAPVVVSSALLPEQVDDRQGTLFAAGWTTGSIAVLAENRALGMTYYRLVGERGLFFQRDSDRHPLFPKGPIDFPVLAVFQFLSRASEIAVVRQVASSHPLEFSGLALAHGEHRWLLVANHTGEHQHVSVEAIHGTLYMKYLAAANLLTADWLAEFWKADPASLGNARDGIKLSLPPFGIALVSTKRESVMSAAK
ncbi:hypothetical protein [Parapedobacter sp. 2B3]|uniref:hypothetical protein n=1 Tax=Parapedobacter sp. 2B3 TaxID=3342381 RepID=UPI0035B60BFA